MNMYGFCRQWRAKADGLDAEADELFALIADDDDYIAAAERRHMVCKLRERATRLREWADIYARNGELPGGIRPTEVRA